MPTRIAQTTPWMLANVLDFGLAPQAAVEAPRMLSFGRPWSTTVGCGVAILLHANGVLEGGADPRRETQACGW
jgi:gamma-glutamyltranspeptidase